VRWLYFFISCFNPYPLTSASYFSADNKADIFQFFCTALSLTLLNSHFCFFFFLKIFASLVSENYSPNFPFFATFSSQNPHTNMCMCMHAYISLTKISQLRFRSLHTSNYPLGMFTWIVKRQPKETTSHTVLISPPNLYSFIFLFWFGESLINP
jgi:hypothetical protein